MKTPRLFTVLSLGLLLAVRASAGTLFYVPIPPAQSDANAGLDPALAYTNAVAAGNQKEAARSVNGVTFQTMTGAGNAVTANNVTLSAATGTLKNGGGKSDSIKADGALGDVFTGMIFNDGAEDGSEQYIVLEPAGLTAGKTYDLRVYICNSSSQNREVNLSFLGDGNDAVSTDFFNQDDATTLPGGFAEPNQAYYITYRYKWDGVSSPGITITQRFGATPFCFYAVTNHEVAGGESAAKPAGAIAGPEPIADRPVRTVVPIRRPGRNFVVEKDEEDVGVSSEVFYEADSLRSHGRWVEVGGRRCWRPIHVAADWSPYTRGRWVHSDDDGWFWDSDEEFGWATYHYGRWFREEDSGWYWVPGRVWAPAWVSWRYGAGHVGWAPLPPVAVATVGVGIGRWVDLRFAIGPSLYNFVPVRDFGAPALANVIIPRQQNVNIVRTTNNITNIVNNRTVIYNGGPNIHTVNNIINRAGAQQVPTVAVKRQAAARALTPEGKFSQLKGGTLAVAAPAIVATKGKVKPPKTDVPPIKSPKIDRGWSGITDPAIKSSLTSKMATEAPVAARNAPARMPGTPVLGSKPDVAAVKKPGTSGKVQGPPLAQPGGLGVTDVKKPGAPLTPPGESLVPPTQPGRAKVARVKKPGMPVKPPSESVLPPSQVGEPRVTAVKKHGVPAKPPGEAVAPPTQPGEPKVTSVKKNGSNVRRTGETAVPPPPQVKPVVTKPVTPDQPPGKPAVQSQPARPTAPIGKKSGKNKAPVEEPVRRPTFEPTPKPSRFQPDAAEPMPAPRVKSPVDVTPRPVRPPTPQIERAKPVESVNRPRPVQRQAPVTQPVQPAAPVVRRPVESGSAPTARRTPPVQPPQFQSPAARPANAQPKGQPGELTDEEKRRKRKGFPPLD